MTNTVNLRHVRAVAASRQPLARWRLAVTLLALITFSCQTYLVQTHIHGLPASVAVDDGRQLLSAKQSGEAPADGDQAKCLLCQEFLHSGAYVMPAAFAALPPAVAVSLAILVATPLLAAKSPSHIWLGRAPPRA